MVSKRKLAGEAKFAPMFSIRIQWLKTIGQMPRPEILVRSWMAKLMNLLTHTFVQRFHNNYEAFAKNIARSKLWSFLKLCCFRDAKE